MCSRAMVIMFDLLFSCSAKSSTILLRILSCKSFLKSENPWNSNPRFCVHSPTCREILISCPAKWKHSGTSRSDTNLPIVDDLESDLKNMASPSEKLVASGPSFSSRIIFRTRRITLLTTVSLLRIRGKYLEYVFIILMSSPAVTQSLAHINSWNSKVSNLTSGQKNLFQSIF